MLFPVTHSLYLSVMLIRSSSPSPISHSCWSLRVIATLSLYSYMPISHPSSQLVNITHSCHVLSPTCLPIMHLSFGTQGCNLTQKLLGSVLNVCHSHCCTIVILLASTLVLFPYMHITDPNQISTFYILWIILIGTWGCTTSPTHRTLSPPMSLSLAPLPVINNRCSC